MQSNFANAGISASIISNLFVKTVLLYATPQTTFLKVFSNTSTKAWRKPDNDVGPREPGTIKARIMFSSFHLSWGWRHVHKKTTSHLVLFFFICQYVKPIKSQQPPDCLQLLSSSKIKSIENIIMLFSKINFIVLRVTFPPPCFKVRKKAFDISPLIEIKLKFISKVKN